MAARPRGRPFQKGQSGNPGGRPKVVVEIQELARAESPEMLRVLVSIAKNPKMTGGARAHAAVAVIERGYGKPPQDLTVRNADADPESLTDAELMARIRAAEAALGLGGGAAPPKHPKITH